ncbi:bifunctional helix-turn-helix transcriptional regulator/GNAT family N-acetyltransferase [Mucilaginibacter celer]|uniref:GNAT family N-acetyltransferase n=1 Tax=Mucilaginibacter celer TaxID=2305508 RepID=A0A494W5P4_9SPHI|nr:bifunctional helix-turn-helix transcriptional regulator/GNAT family N-acetyltransferase [Mucilaginibacter celer]AYL98835.1 GNAT family N-acetyltransferase [Mucilaginibacter celer]
MEFFNKVGKMAIGSRLRMLTETITEDAARIYKLYDNIDFQPKWFPVFYTLQSGDELTITAIAKQIGHSHPSVSKIIAEMVKRGFVTEKKDKADGRRNMVSLSAKGREASVKIQAQYADVSNAVEELSAQASHDLWQAIDEWEYLLEQKSLLRRVQEQQKIRESGEVQIVSYEPRYARDFRNLNEEWISNYFKMEEADYRALDNPDGYIINKGGAILVALYHGEAVGVCALLKMNDPDYDFELAKMAVSPKAQGKNIGYLLGKAIVEKAKELGANKLYLESNTILKPAISLYHKLGFTKVAGRPSPYERSNIQMELDLG